jgi:diguanylate cyclase (GGDEF)-like protein
MAVLSLVLVTTYNYRRKWLLWLPCILNALCMCTAFFSPLAFYFDEVDYAFRRGPLGYSVFVVCAIYLVLLLWSVNRRFGKNQPWEQRTLYFCGVFSAAAAVLDILRGGTRLSTSIMISAIFFYIFLRTQDASRDALTHLLNRQAFYDDAPMNEAQISAVASADMNGLKAINDSEGHAAGDRAIAAIGGCLLHRASRSVIPYRVGGDEFLILFLKTPEPEVRAALERFRSDVEAAGCSISLGVAFREEDETLMELYRRSDERMYEDKERWYAARGRKR